MNKLRDVGRSSLFIPRNLGIGLYGGVWLGTLEDSSFMDAGVFVHVFGISALLVRYRRNCDIPRFVGVSRRWNIVVQGIFIAYRRISSIFFYTL